MQGRARGRKGERKTYHISVYHHITMEFGGYLLNVAKNTTRARARKGEAQGVLSYQKATGIFDNPQVISISLNAGKNTVYSPIAFFRLFPVFGSPEATKSNNKPTARKAWTHNSSLKSSIFSIFFIDRCSYSYLGLWVSPWCEVMKQLYDQYDIQ